MPSQVDGRGCLERSVDGVKVKTGFTRIGSRWISCVCHGHGDRECFMNAVKKAVGLKRDGLLQGYMGLEVITTWMREKRRRNGCVQILPQECTKYRGGTRRKHEILLGPIFWK